MADKQRGNDDHRSPSDQKFGVAAPQISLPKGGGAVRGIGEKFAANPVTGTGSMSVPIATSPGRSGFGPQLGLSYDSGAGNGPFGIGWNLSLPAITRKTDKGLPRYLDGEESDVFVLSGAEDLVPFLVKEGDEWKSEAPAQTARTMYGQQFRVQRYRPRVEGLFARIERWTNQAKPWDIFWRSISKDNITTWYGRTEDSRIADPADPDHPRIFSWLICESYDDKGNVIVYRYKKENSDVIVESAAHERNRDDTTRSANRYLKRILYGGNKPYLPKLSDPEPTPLPDKWMFEVVFDYGEHDKQAPISDDKNGKWNRRKDPFSSYRAGFEVRTYRLCQRVLMFHHFPQEAGVDNNCLVRSTDFTYSYEKNPDDSRNPIYSFLHAVSQSGYKRKAGGGYLSKSLPPLEFTYSELTISEELGEVDPQSLENLPSGLDGTRFQWVDLDGEGLSGILTEQGGSWYYKRNLSALPQQDTDGKKVIAARFAPVERVARQPSSLGSGGTQLLDLAGDGQLDLVQFDGPTPGFFERTADEDWESFSTFGSLPVLDWKNPNLKFIDLTGDGHADLLISEDEAFCWHASLAEAGFGPAQRVRQALEEEKGPRLIFADGTESIFLADLSGDGLVDLVRITHAQVCYWPNLGYGRFGAKVAMDNPPHFECRDLFDGRRIRLADIDGSGTTDIIYLAAEGVQVYFNQSGNGWSTKNLLRHFPRVDSLSSVVALDLLGNGTACLAWSSPLPGDARLPMRYVDLMGGQKPHLLVTVSNNLGAETHIDYAPSTRFYLADKLEGKPWITKVPFPVHVVEKVTVTDKWRKTSFSSTYSYHHGYFDGVEREFRGFGCVEQVDVESYGEFTVRNSTSPYTTADDTLYQPPVKTVTWYHTGAFLDRERILSHFEGEYVALKGFNEHRLPEPDLGTEDLNAEEWREALRACKGMMLRQEVYELDVAALERPDQPEQRPVKLYSTAYHNCQIRRLQPQAGNLHAVFLVAESEAITYHYELDLPGTTSPDPRIAHTLNLRFDEYANPLQSVSVVYPRLGQFVEAGLDAEILQRIHDVQTERHLAYTETRYTKDFGDGNEAKARDDHRLRVPCEVLTYELTGIRPGQQYFTLGELQRYGFSEVHQVHQVHQTPPVDENDKVSEIAYHEIAKGAGKQKRLVEHLRMLFFKDDPAGAGALKEPLPFGELSRLGLLYETYKLALTDNLLDAVFTDAAGNNKLDETFGDARTVRDRLHDASISGYFSGADLVARFASVPAAELAGQYWIRSGIAGFADDAAQHYYLPERYTDPFGKVTTLDYDPRDLFVASSTDMLKNTTRVTVFDYRVLAPREMQDINDNLSEVFFDVLGLPAATALKGKGNEGDNLDGFDDAPVNLGRIHPTSQDLEAFFNAQPDLDDVQARNWLSNATARHIYYFGEIEETLLNGTQVVHWMQHPPCACGLVREQHVAQLAPGAQSPIQAAFEYSDGMGSVLVKKIQAEPEAAGQALRWVASGKTILNNKGKPVKQYESYFSSPEVGHRFEEPEEVGVTAVIYYDAVGRTVRTELPDGSFSRVEFSPWHVRTFDQNDTVKESQWYKDRNPPDPDQPLPRNSLTGEILDTPDQRAAWLAAQHAETPALTLLDSLGREVISVSHNRVKDAAGVLQDEKYSTFTRLDAEGKPLWIRDARKNLVMQYITRPVANDQATDPADYAPCYDIAGNLLFQHSMDAGDRWMLNDVAGKSMFAWDSRGHVFRTEYDPLHRPTGNFVKGSNPLDAAKVIQFEKLIYGDTPGNGLPNSPSANDQTRKLNLRGKPYKHYDTAGMVASLAGNPATGTDEAFDFKGNPLRSTRQLVSNYKTTSDWSQNPAPTLEAETFSSSTRYDALNRPIQIVAPHGDQPGSKFNVTRPGYNAANLLERVDVWLEQVAEPNALLNPATASLSAVANIDYDAKGQRTLIQYGNGAETRYRYDEETFRLIHLYTRRGATFSEDCGNDPPLPRTAAPEEPPAGIPCGVQNLHYTYDPVGNITAIRDDAQQTVFFNKSTIAPSNAYEYDALYRLIHAEGREHAAQSNIQRDAGKFEPIIGIPFPNSPEALQRYGEDYEYDPVGNILGLIHSGGAAQRWNRRYQYAINSNHLLATCLPGEPDNLADYTAVPGYGARYGYDAHGNMTSMPHLPVMEWDFKDQLQASQQQVNNGAAGEKTWYVYDASGERVRKVTELPVQTGQPPRMKDERIYLGGYEVYRKYNGNGQTVTLERETLHVMDDKQRVALIEMRTRVVGADPAPPRLVRFQLGNHLGSAALELDEKGSVISYEEYFPYGTTSYQAVDQDIKAAAKRYRYTGKERDEETGFSYHGARYYAPWLGRWASADPSGIQSGLNLYSYVHDRPTVFLDPNGKWAAIVIGIAAVLAVGLITVMTSESEAGAPKNVEQAKAVKPAVTDTEFLAHATVSAVSGGVGTKVAGMTMKGAPVVLKGLVGGTTAGLAQGVGDQAIDDVKAGEVSSVGIYAKRSVNSGAVGGVGSAVAAGGGAFVKSEVRGLLGAGRPPSNPYDVKAWAKYRANNPGANTSTAGAAAAPGSQAAKAQSAALRKAFMAHELNTTLKEGKKGPLAFLIDWKTRTWKATTHLSSEPSVQAGHRVSRHSGAPERFGLEDAFENQRANWRGETQGVVFDREFVKIGEHSVEKVTAQHWEAQGHLAKGTVDAAPKHLGWRRGP
jgi:RHS repeat-associated protein